MKPTPDQIVRHSERILADEHFEAISDAIINMNLVPAMTTEQIADASEMLKALGYTKFTIRQNGDVLAFYEADSRKRWWHIANYFDEESRAAYGFTL